MCSWNMDINWFNYFQFFFDNYNNISFNQVHMHPGSTLNQTVSLYNKCGALHSLLFFSGIYAVSVWGHTRYA
jgi:hypothetical protein